MVETTFNMKLYFQNLTQEEAENYEKIFYR